MMTDEQAAKIPGIKMICPGVWREADDSILVLQPEVWSTEELVGWARSSPYHLGLAKCGVRASNSRLLGELIARGALAQVLYDPALRELMVALEFLRAACEHAEGRYLVDRERLASGMRVGIEMLAKHSDRVPDHKLPSYWADVRKLAETLGRRCHRYEYSGEAEA